MLILASLVVSRNVLEKKKEARSPQKSLKLFESYSSVNTPLQLAALSQAQHFFLPPPVAIFQDKRIPSLEKFLCYGPKPAGLGGRTIARGLRQKWSVYKGVSKLVTRASASVTIYRAVQPCTSCLYKWHKSTRAFYLQSSL